MEKNNSELAKLAITWGVVALIFAVIACTFNTAPMVVRAGFFAKLIAVVVGTALGIGGALLGDAVRRFAHPDAVFTTGGMLSLVWIKLFWKVGPQLVGLVIGVAVGVALVLR